MLTGATPRFEQLPATLADPVGLADQQAAGVVSLIVVRYAETEDALSVLGGVYDAFVCVSGQLVTVARTTSDYRFPIMPAVALRRFIEHRDAGKPAFLSLYELEEDECARFVETIFYSECMKLRVGGYGAERSGDGAPASQTSPGDPDARLVADQLARSGCGNGVLELNDFTDPDRPRIRLVDLHELSTRVGVVPAHAHPAIPGGTIDPAGLAAVLSGYLAGFTGRVLLYDRAKNRAALPGKGGTAWDLMAAIREANRLAQARRGGDAQSALASLERAQHELRASAEPDQADQVEAYLRERAERPRAVGAAHPHATGLAALVAELQGGPAASLRAPFEQEQDDSPPPGQDSAGASLFPTDHAAAKTSTPASAPDDQPVSGSLAAVASAGGEPAPKSPQAEPLPAPTGADDHPLAGPLASLRTGVYALFSDAVGEDRAELVHAHVLSTLEIDGDEVPPQQAIAYLRALLIDPPPKRWMLYKRSRSRIADEVCGRLLAFHSECSHVCDPALDEASKLWARLRT
jgi:hypothetical protein